MLALQAGLPSPGPAATIARVTAESRTDADLIALVARGDGGAFDELYRRYARSVLGIALRRIGDHGRAEDAVQETFANLWRSSARFDAARGAAAAWIFTIARNAIVDSLRRRREPVVADASDAEEPGPGPEAEAEAEWVSWRVHRALETIPDHERSLVELAYWSGLSQAEIARRLDLPLGTVKTRTRSALHRLADELGDELR